MVTATGETTTNAALEKAARELLPGEGKRIEVRPGIHMHVLDQGEGDPMVMVHGNPSWCLYYRRLVEAFQDRYRCIVPDHIGCGLSDKPGEDQYSYVLESRIADLTTVLDKLGVTERVTLVVHDWGGMIGTGWAVRHADRVKRIVLLNTAAFFLPKSKGFPWQLWLARSPLGAMLVRGMNMFSRGATRQCVTRRPMPKEVREAYCAPYDSWEHRLAVHRFVQDIPLRPTDPSWSTVAEVEGKLETLAGIPTLCCWGLRDFVFDKHFLAEWRERLPGAEYHVFDDAGHYVLEDAHEDIIPLMEDFLTRHPVDSEPAATDGAATDDGAEADPS